MFSLLLIVNSLFNAYTPIYDLALLIPAVLLTAEHLIAEEAKARRGWNTSAMVWVYLSLAVLFFGPHLSQSVAKLTGCQPFTLALLALTVWQARQFWRATQANETLVSAGQREAPAGSI